MDRRGCISSPSPSLSSFIAVFSCFCHFINCLPFLLPCLVSVAATGGCLREILMGRGPGEPRVTFGSVRHGEGVAGGRVRTLLPSSRHLIIYLYSLPSAGPHPTQAKEPVLKPGTPTRNVGIPGGSLTAVLNTHPCFPLVESAVGLPWWWISARGGRESASAKVSFSPIC